MLRSQKQQRGENRCVEIVPATGRPCNLLFTRAWNLKRHQRDQHQDRGIVFRDYDPTAAQRNPTNPPAPETPMPRTPVSKTEIGHRLVPVIPAPSCPAPAVPPHAPSTPPTITMPKQPVPYASSEQTPTPAISESTSTPSEMGSPRFLAQPVNDGTPNRSRRVADGEDPESPTSTGDASIYWTPLQSASGSPVEQGFDTDETRSDGFELDAYREERISRPSGSCENPSGVGRKRKRQTENARTGDARFLKSAVPTYLVKRSKKTPGQQRGLEWLSASGKAHFDDYHEMLLGQWGVKAEHRGTCVRLPEDWKALDPIDLMTTFQDYKPPSRGSGRAWYSYSDHATSLARAAAWYGHWPRSGVKLDNFLGCGPFKPMDGSHLCHHEHCIVHLTYESADTNLDRWNCCLEARFLRQEGRQVPGHFKKIRYVEQKYSDRT